MKNIFLYFIIILLFTACQKQPTANFSTDKTTYTAGETIHCTDASTNAHHWLWTMPDGSTYTTQNVDYVIDTNDIGGTETITLETFSKNKRKISTISKTITVNQAILASDFYSFNGITYKPVIKNSILVAGYWTISAGGFNYSDPVVIKLYDSARPTVSMTYGITSNHNLLPGQASLHFFYGSYDAGHDYGALSGQLVVTVGLNGRLRVVFNNLPVTAGGTSSNNISGDITCF